MLLYSLTGATAVAADDGKQYEPEPGDDGAFSFPGPLAAEMLAAHLGGKPQWETEIQRRQRLITEEAERRKDPATLLAVVEQLVAQAAAQAPAKPAQAAKPAAAKAPAK